MNYNLIKKEGNNVSLKIAVTGEEFEVAVKKAYQKEGKKFNLPGFRKGKAPRRIIESQYGAGVFFEEAINILLPEAYGNAVDELKIDPVDRPEIDIESVDKTDGVVITANVVVKPEIKLGEYKGVEVENINVEISDEDVAKEVEAVREQNGRLVTKEEGAVVDGDTANINYAGFLGEEQFEGGTAEGHELVIGSGQFIPGFEEQIVGANVGDDIEVKVSFPEDYNAEHLAGQEVVFKVKVNSIKSKELPELDDEFAKDISEFDTLDEYKNDLKAKMQEQAKNNGEAALRDRIIDAAVANVEIDLPEAMVLTETDQMLREFDYQLKYQGLDLEKYCQFSGTSIDDLKEKMQEDATARVRTSLTLEEIAKAEKVEVSEEDLAEELEKMAEARKSSIDEIKKMFEADNYEYIKSTIVTRKTVDLLVESAKLK